MITSIKINGTKISTGVLTLTGFGGVYISSTGPTISIDNIPKDTDRTIYYEYLDKIKGGYTPIPYISKVSGVGPSSSGNLWLLGGISSNVYPESDGSSGHEPGNTLLVSDVAQTTNYPRIYKSVFEMLRQLRLWIDAHKDALLLREENANTAWDAMNNPDTDWKPKDMGDYPEWKDRFIEARTRQELVSTGSIPHAVNLLGEYFGIVSLWNYIVGLPDSIISARLHPADSAGLYIGVNVNVPITVNKSTSIRIDVLVSFKGQGDGNYVPEDLRDEHYDYHTKIAPTMWVRVPMARIIPNDSEVIASINGMSIDPVITTGASGGNMPEGTDSGGILTKTGVELDVESIRANIHTTIPEGGIRNSYTVQGVIEVIPFFKCAQHEENYTESKKADHYVSIGYNTWDIEANVYHNNSLIQTIKTTKNTPHMSVCKNQFPDIDDEDSSGSGV